ncbi:MAG TPA: Hsp20 family protein [Devosiaceae bacterium]|nr:Hsp20 family protein [Devosiaceae bacterium]
MTRMSLFSSPFLLGFDEIEARLERLAKGADAYPPYNIERATGNAGDEMFLISLAVAGFTVEELEVISEDNQLVIRGRQADDASRDYLHRGIAARQFQRTFLLADGMTVTGAELRDGLLTVIATRPPADSVARRVPITAANGAKAGARK